MRIRLLILEDEPADAELTVRELERSGFEVDWRRVESEEGFVAALEDPPDVIISDYSMPQFSAPRALEILQASHRRIPFLIVSGTIGEEVAVTSMRAGASDYLLKDRLARLGVAVQHLLEQREIQEAHRAAEEERLRLAAAVEQAGEGIVILDPSGRIEYLNPAYAELVGFSSDDAVGRLYCLLDDTVALPSGAAAREGMRRALATDRSWRGRVDHPTADDRTIEMDLSLSPVRDERGSVYCFVCVLRDLSERVLLERALRQGQKMEAIGRLAGGMAHDFNNLLTVILGYGELILARFEPETPNHRELTEVVAAGKRGARLTRQLLAFSRREALASERIDPNATLTDLESLLRRLIGEDVEIRMDLSPETPIIWTDRGQIEQVVLNLAVNARDAMPGGGTLEIESRRVDLDGHEADLRTELAPGTYAVLVVRDSGHGIDAETQAHIFEPFFTTKRVGEGTGLGLSTVFGIAHQSGGTVEVESEPGAGAEFRVWFPAATDGDEKPEPELEPRGPQTPEERGGKTVLVVEDEEATGALISRLLRAKGYVVLLARNGVEAHGLAGQHPGDIDLLLTDVIMPMVSGPELAEQLRARTPGLRVLFMTGYSGKLLEAHAFDPDTESLIHKPFTLNELDRAVRRALRGGNGS